MASTTTHLGADPKLRTRESSDRDLLRAAADGSEQAFAEVYRKHVGALRGFIAARVGPHNAEDLVIETFTVAWSSSDRFDRRFTSARPWLYGIATKLMQRHRAMELRWQRSLEALDVSDASVCEDISYASMSVDPTLVQAIARLDVRERDVLLLVALGELRVAEAAAALGISPVAARIRLHRARKRLISDLKGAHDA